MNVRTTALLAVLTSLCVGIQLTPRPPNIELTSVICFLTGFLFGAHFGASLGGLTMFLNGFLSPWGFGGVMIPFQVGGMMLIGTVGGIYRRSLRKAPSLRWFSLEVAILGAFLTLVYDLLTNIGTSILFDVNLIVVLIAGTWFMAIHVISNTLLFGTALFGLVRIVGKVIGEPIWSYQKEV